MMTVEEFKALPWRRQNDELESYVLASLQAITEPTSTMRTIIDVAQRVGWLDETGGFLPGASFTIGNVLKRFARHKPGWAAQDGETFLFAGKEARRWRWLPQPKRSAEIDDLFS